MVLIFSGTVKDPKEPKEINRVRNVWAFSPRFRFVGPIPVFHAGDRGSTPLGDAR
jgi:hypothetical protein